MRMKKILLLAVAIILLAGVVIYQTFAPVTISVEITQDATGTLLTGTTVIETGTATQTGISDYDALFSGLNET